MFDNFMDAASSEMIKENIVFAVSGDPNLRKLEQFEINGAAEVTFNEKYSSNISKVGMTLNSTIHNVNFSVGSVTDPQDSNRSKAVKEKDSERNARGAAQGWENSRKLIFVGTFMHLEKDCEGYKAGDTIGYGILVKGQHILFRGIANISFNRLVGVKF